MLKASSKFRVTAAAAFVFFFLFFLGPLVGAQVNIKPRKITFKPGPDGSYSGSFEIVNKSSSELTMTVRLSDWDMNTKGKVNLEPVGSGKRSLSKWISGYPERVEVPAEGTKEVDFRVELPENEEKARWGAFIVRPIEPEEKKTEGLNIGIKVQYAVTLYQQPGKSERSGQITRLNLRQTSGDLLARFRFDNTSRTFLRPQGTLRIKNESGESVLEKEIDRFVVLPEHRRMVAVGLKTLPPGRYLATLTLDYGAKEKVGALRKFEVD